MKNRKKNRISLKILFITIISFCISCKILHPNIDKNCNCSIYNEIFEFIIFPKERYPLSEIFSDDLSSIIIIETSNIVQYSDIISEETLNAMRIQLNFTEWENRINSKSIFLENFQNTSDVSIHSCLDYLTKSNKKYSSRLLFYKYDETFETYSEYHEFIKCCKYNSIKFSNILFDKTQHAFISAFWQLDNGNKVFFYFIFGKKNKKWELKSFWFSNA